MNFHTLLLKSAGLYYTLNRSFIIFVCLFVLVGWGLNPGLHTCKAGALALETHLQSILLWLFWKWGLTSYLPGADCKLCSQPPK
jgi:hypothetical protein